jgi:uncharacterized protein (DUF4415 family)
MKDAEIDYSDIPPLDKSFFAKAREAWPPAKQQLTIRLDADVLNWLKTQGRGYQTRINRILRAAMEGQRPRRPRSTPAAPKKNARAGNNGGAARRHRGRQSRPPECRGRTSRRCGRNPMEAMLNVS